MPGSLPASPYIAYTSLVNATSAKRQHVYIDSPGSLVQLATCLGILVRSALKGEVKGEVKDLQRTPSQIRHSGTVEEEISKISLARYG